MRNRALNNAWWVYCKNATKLGREICKINKNQLNRNEMITHISPYLTRHQKIDFVLFCFVFLFLFLFFCFVLFCLKLVSTVFNYFNYYSLWGDLWRQCPAVCARIIEIPIVLCPTGVCTSWFVQGPCFWNSHNILYSKTPLDSAVVHPSQSKNQIPLMINIDVTPFIQSICNTIVTVCSNKFVQSNCNTRI